LQKCPQAGFIPRSSDKQSVCAPSVSQARRIA
jgi:hypothetical protein